LWHSKENVYASHLQGAAKGRRRCAFRQARRQPQVEAARRIKFVPAMKDGKPVSMFMQLEYNFSLF